MPDDPSRTWRAPAPIDPRPMDGFQSHALSPSMFGGANRQRVRAARGSATVDVMCRICWRVWVGAATMGN